MKNKKGGFASAISEMEEHIKIIKWVFWLVGWLFGFTFGVGGLFLNGCVLVGGWMDCFWMGVFCFGGWVSIVSQWVCFGLVGGWVDCFWTGVFCWVGGWIVSEWVCLGGWVYCFRMGVFWWMGGGGVLFLKGCVWMGGWVHCFWMGVFCFWLVLSVDGVECGSEEEEIWNSSWAVLGKRASVYRLFWSSFRVCLVFVCTLSADTCRVRLVHFGWTTSNSCCRVLQEEVWQFWLCSVPNTLRPTTRIHEQQAEVCQHDGCQALQDGGIWKTGCQNERWCLLYFLSLLCLLCFLFCFFTCVASVIPLYVVPSFPDYRHPRNLAQMWKKSMDTFGKLAVKMKGDVYFDISCHCCAFCGFFFFLFFPPCGKYTLRVVP